MSDYVERHSSGILRVARKTDSRNLASAMITMLRDGKHKTIQIRAAGPDAINRAIKAWIIAEGQATQRNQSLYVKPTFDIVPGEAQTGNVTIIVLNMTLIPFVTAAKFFEEKS